MANFLTHGLSALMEAVSLSKNAEETSDNLMVAFEEAIDEDVIGCLTGDESGVGEDSVDSDMNGNGIGDEDSKMQELLDKIPPSDEDVEDKIAELTESCLPDLSELGL